MGEDDVDVGPDHGDREAGQQQEAENEYRKIDGLSRQIVGLIDRIEQKSAEAA